MADKEVKIKITTAADTKETARARAELEKLEKKAEELRKVINYAGGKGVLGGWDKELEETEAKAAKLRDALGDRKGLAGEAKNLAAAVPKAAAGTANAGRAALEASRAFEDLQYGIRGVLNNIPGLVMALGGGAGVAGVISMAAVALSILGPKIKEFLGSAKEGEMGAEDFAAKLKEVVDNAGKAAAALALLNNESASASYKANADAIGAVGDQLERQSRLEKQIRDDRLAAENAEAAANIKEIEASGLGDEEKLRKIAEIQNAMAQAKKEAALADIEASETAAARQEQEAADVARAANEQAEIRQRELKEAEESRRIAKAERKRNQDLRTGLGSVEEQLKGKRDQLEAIRSDTTQRGQYGPSADIGKINEIRDEIAALQTKQSELARAITLTPAEEKRNLDAANADVKDLVPKLEKAREEQEAKNRAAVDAALDADIARKAAASARERIARVSEAEGKSRGISVETGVRGARDKERKEQLLLRQESLEEQLDDTARDAARMIGDAAGRTGDSKFAKTLEGMASQLSDGTNDAEIQRAAQDFRVAAQGFKGPVVEAMRLMLDELNKVTAELENVKGQIRNNRN